MKKLLLLMGLSVMLFAKTETIVFAAGCFWGVEKYFDNLPGVVSATSGYAGGSYENPTYKEVLKQRDADKGVVNHTEAVEVVYNTDKIGTQKLTRLFWELHDPTQGDRQGNDKGNNYRSALYYTNDAQKKIALETKAIYSKLLHEAGFGKITTEIGSLKKFYKAEGYHQDYLAKNPNGYCPNHATGVKFKKQEQVNGSISPLGGKEIIVIDAEHCGFCKKFKADVTDGYRGSIVLRTVKEKDLKGFTLKNKIEGTPTILLIEDGKEIYAHTGYMDEKDFYKLIGKFKLGKTSEAYKVAYRRSTDSRFCKQYEIFKHTGDGVFVDKISGDVLFDTRDRFDSGSGWLSFFKAVDGAVIEKKDTSFNLDRTEIIAKKSGAHLGHRFNDAPGGRDRFCINATVLEFVPREKIKGVKVSK